MTHLITNFLMWLAIFIGCGFAVVWSVQVIASLLAIGLLQ